MNKVAESLFTNGKILVISGNWHSHIDRIFTPHVQKLRAAIESVRNPTGILLVSQEEITEMYKSEMYINHFLHTRKLQHFDYEVVKNMISNGEIIFTTRSQLMENALNGNSGVADVSLNKILPDCSRDDSECEIENDDASMVIADDIASEYHSGEETDLSEDENLSDNESESQDDRADDTPYKEITRLQLVRSETSRLCGMKLGKKTHYYHNPPLLTALIYSALPSQSQIQQQDEESLKQLLRKTIMKLLALYTRYFYLGKQENSRILNIETAFKKYSLDKFVKSKQKGDEGKKIAIGGGTTKEDILAGLQKGYDYKGRILAPVLFPMGKNFENSTTMLNEIIQNIEIFPAKIVSHHLSECLWNYVKKDGDSIMMPPSPYNSGRYTKIRSLRNMTTKGVQNLQRERRLSQLPNYLASKQKQERKVATAEGIFSVDQGKVICEWIIKYGYSHDIKDIRGMKACEPILNDKTEDQLRSSKKHRCRVGSLGGFVF